VRLLSQPISEMQDSYRGQAAPHGPLLDHYCTLLVNKQTDKQTDNNIGQYFMF
jgi:hypothetical protein